MDEKDYTSASFLCELNASFEAVVHISLPDSFPEVWGLGCME